MWGKLGPVGVYGYGLSYIRWVSRAEVKLRTSAAMEAVTVEAPPEAFLAQALAR